MNERYLSVDVGGTSIKYIIFDGTGMPVRQGSLPKSEKLLPDLAETIGRLFHSEKQKCSGVAVSLNMVLDPVSGDVYGGSDYILNADSFPFRDIVQENCDGVPTWLEKDSNAALTAELRTGNLRGAENAMAIILGTGIGMSICINGRILRGDNYFAGEASTMMIGQPAPSDLESFVWSAYNGVPGFVQRTAAAIREDPDAFDGKKLFEKIRDNEPTVTRLFDEYCNILASQLMNLTLLLDINQIVIGGGISAQNLLFEKVNRRLAQLNAFFRPSSKAAVPHVIPCKYRNDANLYGAFYGLMSMLGKDISEQQTNQEA